MQDITFKMANGKFNLRVAALIIQDSRILVMTDGVSPYFYLPGGRVTLQETTQAAMRRELWEELGEEPISVELRWVVENFFLERQSGEDFHEICFFYQCQLDHRSPAYSRDEFSSLESGRVNSFRWLPIDRLDEFDVVPRFLKDKLLSGNATLQHFTSDQDARTNVSPS